jgi:hypothetical protein
VQHHAHFRGLRRRSEGVLTHALQAILQRAQNAVATEQAFAFKPKQGAVVTGPRWKT